MTQQQEFMGAATPPQQQPNAAAFVAGLGLAPNVNMQVQAPQQQGEGSVLVPNNTAGIQPVAGHVPTFTAGPTITSPQDNSVGIQTAGSATPGTSTLHHYAAGEPVTPATLSLNAPAPVMPQAHGQQLAENPAPVQYKTAAEPGQVGTSGFTEQQLAELRQLIPAAIAQWVHATLNG